ncbi:hypothetical protein B0J13DRAFT_531438 [Dactylonectria estremocensis]|uniref:Uncharacterized protein n=1 Tax=Dactylonectria estremocensis TaxID=1079267 RepID=A0A9P9DPI9_9HYPO|nr:hypothetical protein B0J13DRAFT_531438 [Dactylonectria estremocensis]
MSADSPAETPPKIQLDLVTFISSRVGVGHRPIPQGLESAWCDIYRPDVDATPKVFLAEGGYYTWFAYMCARSDARINTLSHGRNMNQVLEEFENYPHAFQKTVAASVAARLKETVGPTTLPQQRPSNTRSTIYYSKTPPSDSPIPKGANASSPEHRNKRRRAEEIIERPTPSSPPLACPPTSVNDSSQMTMTAAATATVAAISGGVIRSQLATHSPVAPVAPVLGPSTNLATNIVNLNTAIHHVPVKDARRLLPRDLAEAIVTRPDPRNEDNLLVAMSISFPTTENFPSGCHITFEIAPEKVQFYAYSLFRVRLESKNGVQHAFIGDGLKMMPTPKLTLKGAWRDMIPVIFGPEISSAICASPIYVSDSRRRLDSTYSVSFEIDVLPNATAFMHAFVGLDKGIELRDKLCTPVVGS